MEAANLGKWTNNSKPPDCGRRGPAVPSLPWHVRKWLQWLAPAVGQSLAATASAVLHNYKDCNVELHMHACHSHVLYNDIAPFIHGRAVVITETCQKLVSSLHTPQDT